MALPTRPDRGALLLAAGAPLALAWLIDHGLAVTRAEVVAGGAFTPGTGLGPRLLIWVPLWAFAMAAAELVAAGRARSIPIRAGAALRETARRAEDVLLWALPYLVTAAAGYGVWWLLAGSNLTIFGVGPLFMIVTPLLAWQAYRLVVRLPALPLRLLENAGRKASAQAVALRAGRLVPNGPLPLLLVLPLPVALVVDLAGRAAAGALPVAYAPVAVGLTSAVQLLLVSLIVAGQAREVVGRYLAPREADDPGAAANLGWADESLTRLAGPGPRPLRRAWLLAYTLPVLLLAGAALADPLARPVLSAVDTKQDQIWPYAMGLTGAGLPVLVDNEAVTRCHDRACTSRTRTKIVQRRLDAATVTPDGRVLMLYVPELGYQETGEPVLTACDAADRCTERTLGLETYGGSLHEIAVAALPEDAVLVVGEVYWRSSSTDRDNDPVVAWWCRTTCAEIPVERPAGASWPAAPSDFQVGYDEQGGPVLFWTDDRGWGGEPDEVFRAACVTPLCDRLAVESLPPVWRDLPGVPNLQAMGLDTQGRLVVVVSRPGRESCMEWCVGLPPNPDPYVLSVLRCLDAHCQTGTAAFTWAEAGPLDLPRMMVAADDDGPVLVLDGAVTTCVARCARFETVSGRR
ncbi:hypothetical protein [Catellatospora bangladeshensis]|uniref:Uncharacterized protein n=1 Tax=Catellatospora bangladeshensis TaxID=310355 RepID=A0A8J3JDV0_9ACTN|nr:hypothetical protein [Catellatospora bangladeshensis]GIF78848.1 hypothetical protein Cba03nite_01970 [Catellatospora bangladeshensis]